MAEEQKKARKARKSALSREINNLRKLMVEDEYEDVVRRLPGLKDKFKAFEEAHESYHSLIDETLQDDSEEYYEEVCNNYIEQFTAIKTWVVEFNKKPAKEEVKKEELSQCELMSMMNLPKVEIKKYNGDPLTYHAFFALFDEHVHKTRIEPGSKLSRLLQYTEGDAYKAIAPCAGMGNDGYEEARVILKKRFGSDLLISDHIIKSVKEGKPVRTPKDLQDLADELMTCKATLNKMGRLREIDTQSSIIEILNRIQPYLCNRWKRKAMEVKREKEAYPDFADFVTFIVSEAEEATDPVYGTIGAQPSFRNKPVVSSSFASDVRPQQNVTSPCVACNQHHRLFACDTFKGMRPWDRLQLVKNHNLCENCLLNNHSTSQCRKSSVCSVPDCGLKHTKFIHVNQSLLSSQSQDSLQVNANFTKALYVSPTHADVIVPIVKVEVNDKIVTNALLDNASTGTFCSENLLRRLKLQGTIVNYILNTMSAYQESRQGLVVDLCLKSCDGEQVMKLSKVHVVPEIPVYVPHLNLSDYPHLADLSVDVRGPVDILIGQDHAEALIPIQTRRGSNGDPFAVKTLFGWSINGPVSATGPASKRIVSHFIATSSVDTDLHNLWNIENENVHSEKQSWSVEDKWVIKKWDSETKLVDGHYEIPVPWKPDVCFPNNYSVAMSRLKSLQKNLTKRGLLERYQQEMDLLVTKGYAELVPQSELNNAGKCWYLPHQAVVTEKKPEKCRIVFDCAAKFMGESLNDKAFQGPDIVNKLLDILVRFRQHQFAIMADVEAMYNQVIIPVQDRDALRFLWQDSSGNLRQYRMARHLFGGIWCACSSTYALRRIVADNDVDELISDSICKSFYVDDCLQSVSSESQAIQIISETATALSKGGFKLTKFVVNSDCVLSHVPPSDRAKEVKELNHDSKSKVLGIKWDVSKDQFFYDAVVKCYDVTKREMLRIVASLYDPLGLVGPVTINGRMLFQDATRMNLAWDDAAPPDLSLRWKSWIGDLEDLSMFQIPRCVKPSQFDDSAIELHHFSDASSRAYGSCSYIRCINRDGYVHTALIISKSRVAPIKPVSIPRLELQAAVLSARADTYLRNELELDFVRSYCWTDSEIVLRYIKNESRRFHVFVGNRVSVITSFTSSDQWYHVCGEENPADLLTRNKRPVSMDMEKWLYGPKFLRTNKSDWTSQQLDNTLPADDPEVKKEALQVHVTAVDGESHPIDRLAGYFSSWNRLKKAVAWLIRLRHMLHSKHKSKASLPLSVGDIRQAELLIIKHVQHQAYGQDCNELKIGSVLSKQSHLKSLLPQLNNERILCVGGRLKHAMLDEQKKFPIIIPHKHRIAKLIIREEHEHAHLGDEWTLSLVRERYWITRARYIVKQVRRECVRCKILYGKTCVQQMADLPEERLAADKPPFTFIGMDCFGPFMVKVGRSNVKRYGCLFTCMTTRAIHIEKLDSLDTHSFLNGFRRFIGRRGTCIKVFCDNGSNFIGAHTELQKHLRNINSIDKHVVEWHFNPPHASHMGGIWERLIGVTRRVLSAILQDCRLTDEILETVFVEAESIVNSRPLTKLSDHVEDLSPLTPSHLLLLKGSPVLMPGNFSEGDMYRSRWKYVQHLSDQFWKRWLKEYLPELQKRAKWTKLQKNVKEGDLVLVMDENMPRCLWPLGLVLEAKPGKDGLVRSASIRTRSTIFVRPITKLVMLESD